ncbi:hypothetical protein BC937DRAFT_88057 [Endogone sp. FLAS-F59071]|nr:hypothetical protein BC937DRAFT_88057 [Endogone sp. FLAS-F59071]|eukprot:RUS19024.1 hypothetical protein BC937DRAFT_88057 [Endogone sp. FLAS-F59071]
MELAPPDSKALPFEIILFIYKLLQETSDNKSSTAVDFLCCSMVSTSWNTCAAPCVAGMLNHLNIHAHSVKDIHRIAGVLEESRRFHPELGQQVRSLTVQVNDLFEETHNYDENHDKFVLKEDMAKAIADLLVRAFALEDLTFDFDGIACRQCLQNTNSFFKSIMPVSKRLKRLSFDNFRIKDTEKQAPDEQKARENSYTYDPIADFITQQSNLEEIKFRLFDGNDLITHALSTCSNIRVARFDLVDHFRADLLSDKVLPRWPYLHTFSFDAMRVRPHSLVDAIRKKCPLLEDLTLPAHTHEDEDLVVALYQLIRERSDQLKCLSIQNCSIADNSFLIFLCDSLPNIERLDISGGYSYTGKRIKAVVWHNLRYLDITACIRVMPAFLFAVLKNCPRLAQLRMSVTTWREPEVQCRLEAAGFRRRSIPGDGPSTAWDREVPNE